MSLSKNGGTLVSGPLATFSRREFLRIAGVSAAGAALTACGLIAPSPTSQSRGPVQLVYSDWRTPWFPPLAQAMLAEFNASHPNIRVYYTPDPENLEVKMLSDMAGGIAPDVFDGCCDFFQAWANAGYVLDLSTYVKDDLDKETIDDWSQAQYRSFFTSNGIQYGLPKYHGALALYFNKDLFDAAGMEYPTYGWTHDDYLTAMKKLTIRSGDQVTQWGSMFDPSWDRIQMHVNGWGGHYVDPNDPRHCEMAEPPALEAMEWLRARIWDDRVMPTFLEEGNVSTRQAFINGKIAMVEDGSWALKDILDGATFRVGLAPFPAGPQRRVTLASTDGFGIYAGTKHPEAAWEFLKFLVSKEYGRAMAKAAFLQPARSSLVTDWVNYIRQEYPQKSAELDIAAFADGQVKGYSVTAENFSNMVGVHEIAQSTWDQIYTLGKTPVSEMTKVCQQIESIQKSSGLAPVPCECRTNS
jgi:multiple sugar transport system substrate-binding protein